MLALVIALALAGTEGTVDGPGTLSADLPAPSLRMRLAPAPFPLEMSLPEVAADEEAAAPDALDLATPTPARIFAAFELPSYSELMDLKPTDDLPAWLRNWEKR